MKDMHFSISAKTIKRAKWLTYTILILLLTSQLFLPPGIILCRLWPCGMSSSEPRSVALENTIYLSLGTLPMHAHVGHGPYYIDHQIGNDLVEAFYNKFKILKIDIHELMSKDSLCREYSDKPFPKRSLARCINTSVYVFPGEKQELITIVIAKQLAHFYPDIVKLIMKVAREPCHYIPTRTELEQEIAHEQGRAKAGNSCPGHLGLLGYLQEVRKTLRCDIKVKHREQVEIGFWEDKDNPEPFKIEAQGPFKILIPRQD